jgi:sigma-B regulation protein RsbU (phosphoserine phosphatase)
MPAPAPNGWLKRAGLPEKMAVVAAAVSLVAFIGRFPLPAQAFSLAVTLILLLVVGARLGALGVRQAIWRLRNRLIVTYVFIAVIPILLVLLLMQLGAWALTRQVGTYLLNAEMERRIGTIQSTAGSLARVPAPMRAEMVRRAGFFFRERYPGAEILVHDTAQSDAHYPESSTLQAPPPGFGDVRGILAKDGMFYLWAHAGGERTEAVILVPLTRSFLAGLVPGLADVTLRYFPEPARRQTRSLKLHPPVEGEAAMPAPPAAASGNFVLRALDWVVPWFVRLKMSVWEEPRADETALMAMRSPISNVINLVFETRAEDEPFLLNFFYFAAALFVLVQIASAWIGVRLTRTITMAVHNLYEGTERVKEGDFGHRMRVQGNDQLAELGSSFNRMTENLEILLRSEKERQKMQAELEIASEVQNQLHPRAMPGLGSLRLTSLSRPSRMVSGDYFDYQALNDKRMVMAVGDVAGKGISAALLMATLQSAMRSHVRHCMEAGNGGGKLSTARLVEGLNLQLYASTSPEKYATFFFGLYDDETGVLDYTNAGHLPPILLRAGETQRLDVNGTVVGAFPGVEYGQSALQLQSGDLLVMFTDGLTEPENVYGEMFGEERLIELLKATAGRPDADIVNAISDAVQAWTATPELQDDLTLLVARKG